MKPTHFGDSQSLSGHTSPIESAAFDSAEVLVVAGSSSGAIKLWDLEETKSMSYLFPLVLYVVQLTGLIICFQMSYINN